MIKNNKKVIYERRLIVKADSWEDGKPYFDYGTIYRSSDELAKWRIDKVSIEEGDDGIERLVFYTGRLETNYEYAERLQAIEDAKEIIKTNTI